MFEAYLPEKTQHFVWNEKEKRLEIHLSQVFSYMHEMHVYDWASGLDCFIDAVDEGSNNDKFPLNEDPCLDMFIHQDDPACVRWMDSIPCEIKNILRSFGMTSYPLMRLSCQFQGARDLANNNPWLLWLSWKYIQTNALSDNDIASLFCLKQKDLLQKVLGIGSNSAVKILKRLELSDVGTAETHLLKEFFSCEALVSTLRHVEKPNFTMMRLITKFPVFAGQPLLNVLMNIGSHQDRKRAFMLIRDSIRLCEEMGSNYFLLLRNVRSLQSLERIHDQLSDEFQAAVESDSVDKFQNLGPYPAPPHPGAMLILPLNSVNAMVLEGGIMRHCIASYIKRVYRGEYYAYRVVNDLTPATVGVIVQAGEIVRIDQIQGVGNSKPNENIVKLVNDWFIAATKKKV